MASNQITFEVLDALLSPDASRRGQAETFFNGISLLERVNGLVCCIQQLPQQQQQQHHLIALAAVLLRRDILLATDTSALEYLVTPLLSCLLAADRYNDKIRTAIGHCLSEICGTVSLLSPSTKDKEQVMARILTAISNSAAQGDIPSLRLLAGMAERAPIAFTATAVSSLPSLIQQVSSRLNYNPIVLDALMEVLVQAAIATEQKQDNIIVFASQVIDVIDPHSAAASLGRSCLPLLWGPLSNYTSSTNMSGILQLWTQSASSCPSFLAGDKATLEALVAICMKIASQEKTEEDSATSLAALEVLSSICAVGDVKRKILGTDPAFSQRLLQGEEGAIALTVKFMVSGVDDDVEAWAAEPASLLEDAQFDGDDDAGYAESLLRSFLHSLVAPGLPTALSMAEQLLLQQGDWRYPRAGLAILEASFLSAPASFTPHVPVAIEAALSMSSSQNVRVQWQALRLLGILCESESDEAVFRQNGLRMLPTLAQAVKSPCTKVSSLACEAIVAYCRGEKSTIGNENSSSVVCYLPDLLNALVSGPLSLNLTGPGQVVVKIRAIGAVACIAQSCGESFAPYYANIMPGLLACTQLPYGNQEMAHLVGSALEAATLVGQAIECDEATREQFVGDANKIMQFIVTVLPQSANSNLPMDELFSACARIASVMGRDYAPYIKFILPRLLERATAPPDVSVTGGDEAGLEATKRNGWETDDQVGTETMTIALPGKGMQKVTVNTTKIQEKAQAARAVYEHASALGADFGPYVMECLNAFVPLVNFQFSPEVRSTAAQAVASIYEAACRSADEYGTGVPELQKYFPVLIKTMTKQIQDEDLSEIEALYALADALSEVFYSVYQRKATFGQSVVSSFLLDDASATVGATMGAISSCLKRRSGIYRVLSGCDGAMIGEDEKQECEAQLKDEEKLLTPLVDSTGYTLKFFKEAFLPLFDKFVAPALGPALTNGDIRARLCAVCLFDDCVEHCGQEAAAKHASKLIYGVLLGIDDQTNGNDVELKSASIYGICQLCRYAPTSVLAPHIETISQQLRLIVSSTSKEESDSPMMYENAVSAMATLALIGSAPFANAMNISEIQETFLRNLPLREDPDEAKICHDGFCDLVEKGSISVAAETTRILEVIGEILFFVSEGETIASQGTCSRMASVLAHMQQQLPQSTMNVAFQSISKEAQQGISLAMQ